MDEQGTRSIAQYDGWPSSIYTFVREYRQGRVDRRMVGRIIPNSGGDGVHAYHYEVEQRTAEGWTRLEPSPLCVPPLADRRAMEAAMRRAARLLGISSSRPETNQSSYTRIPRRFRASDEAGR